MADYRILCVRKEHGHIVSVGTGTEPTKYIRLWTVAEVRTAIRNGDKFHTVSASTGKSAYVESFDTIRTKPDHVKDDNLNDLDMTCGS